MDDNFNLYLLFVVVVGVIWFTIGLSMGLGEGREQVASGKYECILVPAEDLTTSWVCEAK